MKNKEGAAKCPKKSLRKQNHYHFFSALIIQIQVECAAGKNGINYPAGKETFTNLRLINWWRVNL